MISYQDLQESNYNVSEYLISEGYASTEDAAIVIIENMSEQWYQSIIEDLQKRRVELARRQRENIRAFNERIRSRNTSFKEKLAKRKEKEDLKKEIKRELSKEK